MNHQLRLSGNQAEVLDADGRVMAVGTLVVDYVEGEPGSLTRCSLAFEGVHKEQVQ